MKKHSNQVAFDDTLRVPGIGRASLERAGRRPPARLTPAEYKATISNYIAQADLDKRQLANLPFDVETYEDALDYSPERLVRESVALGQFMSQHWASLSVANKERLLREKRALRLATDEQYRRRRKQTSASGSWSKAR